MPLTPESPPKRMTRARAKAVEETKKAPKTQSKITTAATKAPVPSRTAKRKTHADDDEEQAEDPANRSPPPPQRKATSSTHASAPKSTGSTAMNATKASARNTPASVNVVAPKATRGRPRKNADAGANPGGDKEAIKRAPPARTMSTRTGSVKSSAPHAKASENKKKVTFEEVESDKENVIRVEVPKSKGAAAGNVKDHQGNPSGLRAKPVRGTNAKPATLKPSQTIQDDGSEHEESKAEPLSPKKNAQVSVPALTSEVGPQHPNLATTPTKEFNKSPKKVLPSSIRRTMNTDPSQIEDLAGSVDELQGSAAIFTSPTKNSAPLMIASPAKRPAQSPFKGSIKISPRKSVPTNGNGDQSPPETNLTLTNSIMSKPPRRFPMTEPRKRTTIDQSAGSTFGNSLFGSPAKRPVSPSKASVLGSNMKAPATTSVMRVMTSSSIQASPRRILFSPTKKYTSALQAMKSPEASAKVYKMTAEEQARMFQDELAGAPSPFSPMKKEVPHHEISEPCPSASPLSSKRMSKIPIKSPPKSPRVERVVESQTPLFGSDVQPSPSIMYASRGVESGRRLEAEEQVADQESDDELQLDESESKFSPFTEQESKDSASINPLTPNPTGGFHATHGKAPESMTVLAQRFGEWKGATPDSKVVEQRRTERRVFSPLYAIVDDLGGIPSSPDDSYLGLHISPYEDTIPVHTDEDVVMADAEDSFFRQSQMSEASQEYGDENAIPIDPALLEAARAPVATCTPARVFAGPPQVIHTVYKVPLKPSADYDESPIIKPARSTHSLSGELSLGASFELQALRQIYPPAVFGVGADSVATNLTRPRKSKFSEQMTDEIDYAHSLDMVSSLTPSGKTETWSAAATPARTPRPDLNTKLLSGAVVFVDVHTTEGADASGIFVELLSQMGARCVKQWNWNSRTSFGGSDATTGDVEGSDRSKIGITHVVFKDGGKRTMEKIREAKGLVLCVGVGWVLNCERRNKWLDEAEYAIDTSTIPRGGSRRRKSMEPKALSNITFSATKSAQPEALSPTKEFLNLSSPPSRRATISSPQRWNHHVAFAPSTEARDVSTPATPTQYMKSHDFESLGTPQNLDMYADANFGSPNTPYFLHPQELVQKTCPPKQTQQLFFPLSGRIEDEPDKSMRERLLVARRKSLQWAPKIGSPLSRAHSFQ